MRLTLCFSRPVRVYLSILGAEIKPHEGATYFERHNYTTDYVDYEELKRITGPSAKDPDAGVVTYARMHRGLQILRAKKAEGKGYTEIQTHEADISLFLDACTAEQLSTRPLYPFLPPGLGFDELESFVEEEDSPQGGQGFLMYSVSACGSIQ